MFSQPYKTPKDYKKTQGKQDGPRTDIALSEAPAAQFVVICESDVRLAQIQNGRIGGPVKG